MYVVCVACARVCARVRACVPRLKGQNLAPPAENSLKPTSERDKFRALSIFLTAANITFMPSVLIG